MAEDQNRTLQDKFMLRLPKGMRERIKSAADANGRSMNSEIVAALYDWFPEPTPQEYLSWLHRELIQDQQSLNSDKIDPKLRVLIEAKIERTRQEMIAVINGNADPSTFDAAIEAMSDFRAVHRDS